ncbi:hypothetical protein J2X20_004752 [Pelomonas saccharophila]|uniref:DUF3999 domain-containing protein n=1 Tax=Roseateles saccharophilus TaxID=304 RepID=A0ABU1YT90_ROSSA|nr:DUF3999 family protein [Roseateles saccharophilus]MDR7272078.1 hypothetical protein [Roseateles saccharophilus]
MRKSLFELMLLLAAASATASPYRAPVQITQPAPFLTLDATAEAWQHSLGSDLRDWQLLDAQGRRVPFALLPDGLLATPERELKLFALPPAPTTAASAPPNRLPAGWMLDLGEPAQWPAEPRQVRLRWPADSTPFQAGYRLETSADLQSWQWLGTGQLLGLRTAEGAPLAQPLVNLPGRPQRYLRLVWDEASSSVQPEAATLLAQPAGAALQQTPRTAALPAPDADGGWVISLGGPQPLLSLTLAGSQGTWVLPVQVQTRAGAQAPWQTVARTVFYRVDRGAAPADMAPALPLGIGASELRLLPPRGTALPPAGSLRLDWTVRAIRVVWAAQGEPPFSLQVGAATPESGPRPLADVVPDWNREQSRLGHSQLGAFSAQAVAATTEAAVPPRRLLLWAVLGVGVALLAAVTWRLWRQGPTDTST